MKIGCFIIHLERATERIPQVNHLIKTLPFEARVVKATDGTRMSPAEQASYQPGLLRPHYPFRLRPGEIATFHSHRSCWQEIVTSDLDTALIVEDDTQPHEPQFSRALETATTHLTQGDLVRLPYKLREKPFVVLSEGDGIRLMEPRLIGLGTQAQIVTKEAATRLLSQTERFDRPVDTFMQLQWAHGVRVLTVWPSGISEISAHLGGSQIGRRKSIPEKMRREILRPLYRLKLARRAAMELRGR